MSERLGLAAEVPTLELCMTMQWFPELEEAFRFVEWAWSNGELWLRGRLTLGKARYSAPTVADMQIYLENRDITNPDALARACIEAATP